MTQLKTPISFFTDNDVDDKVGDFLRDSGHLVTRLRDVMLTNTPDPVIDAACREQGLVLVTHNYKHFRRIALDHGAQGRTVKALCRIDMEHHQTESVGRMTIALPYIELDWARKNGRGLHISITTTVIRIHE